MCVEEVHVSTVQGMYVGLQISCASTLLAIVVVRGNQVVFKSVGALINERDLTCSTTNDIPQVR